MVHRPDRTRYELLIDGKLRGVADYRELDGRVTFTHAEVDVALRGRGYSNALVRFALDDVRTSSKLAGATCWFVAEFAEDIFSDEYTEGNARQWLPYVPHDLPELAKRMGGDDKLVEKMSAIFQGAADSEKTFLPDAFYWHGNEPDIHAAYVFSEVGRPDLTQKWVKWVLDERYDATPAGLDGNDDAGTLSAWYVFSALGIYPKVGTTTYYLGSPRYVRSQIMLGENTVTIEAVEANATITEAFWNGSKLPGLTIDHSQLIQGGLLELK